MTYDLIIIGGGVTGTAIARELSRYRLSVAVLEKEVEFAFGVSKSNSGIIHPGTQNPPDSLKGRLCVDGNRLIRMIARELGVDFKEVGELIVIFSREDIPQLQKIKLDAERLGVTGLEIVDRTWLDRHEPNLSPDVVAALYAPTAGIISPYRLVYDLSENAKANGVKFFTSRKVTGIIKISTTILSEKSLRGGHRPTKQSLPAGRQVKTEIASVTSFPRNDDEFSDTGGFEIRTNRETFYARFIINAAGLYADEVAAMVGITDFTIKPRKGEEFLLDKKRENITNHLIFPLPSKTSKGTLIIKTSDGNPMIGPTAEEIDDKEDRSTSDSGLKAVLDSVRRMVPSINGNDIIAYFAGLRPVAGQDFVIRHEDKVPGFINVAGIQSPGLTAAPAIALMAVELLRKNGLVLKRKLFFRKYRAKTKHLFAMSWAAAKNLIAHKPGYGDIVCRCEMVSAQEIKEAIRRGAKTLDGVKFRTRAQAGRCHGGFCTTRIMKILAEETRVPLTAITKRGPGSEVLVKERDQGSVVRDQGR
jgi:glycerol-3-phosphate dehydrogenase